MERHFGGFAEQGFYIFRILQAGQLNDDAVGSLSLDNRLLGSQFVNTAADDLNRLVDDSLFESVQRHFIVSNLNYPVSGLGDIHFVVKLFEQSHCLIAGAEIIDFYGDGSISGFQILIADFVFAQNLADGIFNRSHSLFENVIDFDFQKQVGTALQVEAQINRLPPGGQGFFVFNQVGDCKENADQTYQQD